MATGLAKFTCCHPLALSLANVAVASFVPVAVQRVPTWVPMLPVDLKKRTPVTTPDASDLNLTPTSRAVALPESATPGDAPRPQMEQVQPIVTGTPVVGVSRFPLSSTARDLIDVPGFPCATQL